MTLRHSNWSKLVVAVAVVFAVVLSIGVAQASNMGFKMNKVILPLGTPSPKGTNLVALPYKNPYVTAQDVCAALGLSNVAPKGKVEQIVQTAATPFFTHPSHNCGDLGPFTLTQRVGLIVSNSTAAGGILVGSHQSNPPGTITLQPLGTPSPRGQNHFPVPYHTTALSAQDLCTDLGLPTGANIKRIDAGIPSQPSHNCGDLGPFALKLGESVIISYTGPPIAPLPNVPAGHPAHF